jgi:hypothetical protein
MATDDEETPDDRLIFAVLTDRLDAIEPALREGANINVPVAPGTLLHHAITSQFYQIAEYLITHGAEVNAVDAHGSMPLHLVAMHGRTGLATQLMAKGADRHARDGLGSSPRELTRYGVEIEWDQLSSHASRALKSRKRQELASLLFSGDQPTQALLELCGTHRIIELFTPGRWTGKAGEALGLFEDIERVLPAYWRNLNLIDLAPLRRAAALARNGNAFPRYARKHA